MASSVATTQYTRERLPETVPQIRAGVSYRTHRIGPR